jgi:hypothetical protein
MGDRAKPTSASLHGAERPGLPRASVGQRPGWRRAERYPKRRGGNPRTRTVYEFEEERWTPSRVIVAHGTGQSGVHWPEYKLGPNEGVSQKYESYMAVFKLVDSGKERTADIDEANWRTMEKGSPYRLELGIFGDIRWMVPAAAAGGAAVSRTRS